ncbi:MAG TPA: cupin domain-containing protein [Acidobacteriota bacterium]|nr:cupin domain-containing protein [Acidobacteriota bacterium]
MKRALYGVAALGLVMAGAAGALAVTGAASEDVIRPAELTAAEIAGAIFDHPDAVVRTRGERTTHDFITHLSSDKKFVSGIYRATEGHWTYDDRTYGVDEFMYFIEGSVTLTSEDGTVQEIKAGETATIPKEWKGTWDTQGYSKLYVIYSADGVD